MSQKTNPSYVAKVMRDWEFATKKSLGQNFLIDQNIVNRIVQAADLEEESWVLEIGPGLGALTSSLAKQAAQVVAMEIDGDLVSILRETLVSPKITVVAGDALQLDWAEVLIQAGWQGQKLHLAANLPYYLTTPLIMKALECGLPFTSLVVMVQREVALRMLAEPGNKDYGVLSLAVQYYAEGSMVIKVPRTVFIPAPAVDSAVVKLTPRPPQVSAPREELFAVIRAAFQQRRKTLRNALKALVEEWGLGVEQLEEALQNCGLESTVRGERLSLEQYSTLTEELLKGV